MKQLHLFFQYQASPKRDGVSEMAVTLLNVSVDIREYMAVFCNSERLSLAPGCQT